MCPQFESSVIAYLQGELSGEDRRRTEMHLQLCESCYRRSRQVRMREEGAASAGMVFRGALAGALTGLLVVLFMWQLPQFGEDAKARAAPKTEPYRAMPYRGVITPADFDGPELEQPAPVRKIKAEPVPVKLLTDDPDVVIYWVKNSNHQFSGNSR